mmetsp:Transcript_119376/g.385423  ORF Transcript_119376/g.385423 Transcript_119376/m.385423 type:complete len:228 (-) Transcript_119376:762-1445(-)
MGGLHGDLGRDRQAGATRPDTWHPRHSCRSLPWFALLFLQASRRHHAEPPSPLAGHRSLLPLPLPPEAPPAAQLRPGTREVWEHRQHGQLGHRREFHRRFRQGREGPLGVPGAVGTLHPTQHRGIWIYTSTKEHVHEQPEGRGCDSAPQKRQALGAGLARRQRIAVAAAALRRGRHPQELRPLACQLAAVPRPRPRARHLRGVAACGRREGRCPTGPLRVAHQVAAR